MNHPPGAVIVPCQEGARFHRFTIALADLEAPEGSQRIFGIGMSIVDNLNSAIRQLRPQDEWIWIVGDDHVFEPDTLMRLLDREEDIVAPLCTQRMAPFGLVHYGARIAETDYRRTLQFEELPLLGRDLIEVEVSGSLMLIRRCVLDEIGDPWFVTSNGRINEDVMFCARARKGGFRVMVDPEVQVGHIGLVVAYPQCRKGVWGLVLDFPGIGTSQIFMPGGVQEGHLGELEPAGL